MQRAGRLAGEMGKVAFVHDKELPLHCTIVVKNGYPSALAFTFSHLAVDYQALAVVSAEWRRLQRGEHLPPVTWQPVEQAELERTEAFLSRSARSIAYWRSVLEDVPLDVFDHPAGQPEEPRFIEVRMESVALAVATKRLAEGWTIGTTSVLLVACAIVACAIVAGTVTGRSRAVMQLVHSNRRDPHTRAMVGTVSQDALFVLDLNGSGFAETCQAAEHSAMAAYWNAHHDPVAMDAMRAEVGRRRGREPDLDVFVNDRHVGDWPNLPRLDPGGNLTRILGETRTYVTNAWPGVRFKVFFTIGNATNIGQLSLIIDTAYLRRDIATAMLRAVETLLVHALTEDIPMAGIPRLCAITAYHGHQISRTLAPGDRSHTRPQPPAA